MLKQNPTGPIHCVELRTSEANGPVLEELLAAIGLQPASTHNTDTGDFRLELYCESAAEAESDAARINACMDTWRTVLPDQPPTLSVHPLEREDWAEVWKRHFHAFRVSPRLVVKPTWHAWDGTPADIVLEIDPGMSFGTGQHGTTRACLQFMDRLAYELGGVPFLDLGCGSGILELAAWKLGYRPVRGIDHDPAAVGVAVENLGRTGACGIDLRCADLRDFVACEPSRVVVANILAHVLEAHAERIVACLDRGVPRSYLILSGILDEQYAGVRSRFLPLDIHEQETVTLDGWTTGLFVTAGPSAVGLSDAIRDSDA